MVKANEPGSWQPHWQKLIEHLKGAIPAHWTVIMPADRGLYAPLARWDSGYQEPWLILTDLEPQQADAL